MKTRAAILRGTGQDFEVTELDLDPPKAGEVLIRYVAAGLCHSDEHLRHGDIVPRFPRGITDRIPPMWVGKIAGVDEGFEYESDCTANSQALTCHTLCTDPLDIPYWQEQLNSDGSPSLQGIQCGMARMSIVPRTGSPRVPRFRRSFMARTDWS